MARRRPRRTRVRGGILIRICIVHMGVGVGGVGDIDIDIDTIDVDIAAGWDTSSECRWPEEDEDLRVGSQLPL